MPPAPAAAGGPGGFGGRGGRGGAGGGNQESKRLADEFQANVVRVMLARKDLDEENQVIIEGALPGARLEDLELSCEEGLLTVRGTVAPVERDFAVAPAADGVIDAAFAFDGAVGDEIAEAEDSRARDGGGFKGVATGKNFFI